jgi:hypothetical protein
MIRRRESGTFAKPGGGRGISFLRGVFIRTEKEFKQKKAGIDRRYGSTPDASPPVQDTNKNFVEKTVF